LVKHAFLVTTREWCEGAFSNSNVRIFDFFKRERGIRGLDEGSVCLLLVKAEKSKPMCFWGEFTVRNVREVDADEYKRLSRYIYDVQEVAPGETRWIIEFGNLVKYGRCVPKSELSYLKTRRSKKPISEWVILGLTYIDSEDFHVIEEIRRRAGVETEKDEISKRLDELEKRVKAIEEFLGFKPGGFNLDHSCVEFLLLNMGRMLGYDTYTSDPSMVCNGVRLGDLATLDKNGLSIRIPRDILDDAIEVDILWFRGQEIYAFEVEHSRNFREALLRLSGLIKLNVRLFIVAPAEKYGKFERELSKSIFSNIRDKVSFISYENLVLWVNILKVWIEKAEPYLHVIK